MTKEEIAGALERFASCVRSGEPFARVDPAYLLALERAATRVISCEDGWSALKEAIGDLESTLGDRRRRPPAEALGVQVETLILRGLVESLPPGRGAILVRVLDALEGARRAGS